MSSTPHRRFVTPAAIAGLTSKRHVEAHDVVVHEVHRHGGLVLRAALAESVREPREPAHRHPHAEVLAFHVARSGEIHVRVADHWRLRDRCAVTRRVAVVRGLRLRRIPVLLHDPREVHVAAERNFHRINQSRYRTRAAEPSDRDNDET
jgi:hypothetical protein